jgi:hypothetical protein
VPSELTRQGISTWQKSQNTTSRNTTKTPQKHRNILRKEINLFLFIFIKDLTYIPKCSILYLPQGVAESTKKNNPHQETRLTTYKPDQTGKNRKAYGKSFQAENP